MPVIRTPAIVCTVRKHGEHGAVVRVVTPGHGLLAGYVRGGRSRTLRPVLQPANLIEAELRSRSADQLAGMTVELAQSRAPFFAEPLTAAAFDWVTLLVGLTLPEGQPYPRLYTSLGALLDLICAAPSARWWARDMVRFELLLLAELGFGLDLENCAVSGGNDDLAYVSPRSGKAVGRAEGEPYADRLLKLPRFLLTGEEADWEQLLQGFALTGHFLERAFFSERRAEHLAARDRLMDRLKRVVA